MSDAVGDGAVGVGEMVGVYRHDVHKLRGRRHAAAEREVGGVVVNEGVALGADGDAAVLSRPRGDPEQTVDNHASPYRLSLVSGERAVDDPRLPATRSDEFTGLVAASDPAVLHARWLTSAVASGVNESVYYPYTSLRFHVLLAGALLDNYRQGYEFEELYLVATPPGEFGREASAALAADGVEVFRTVLWSPALALHVTGEPGGRPGVRVGGRPARSFADVWARLPDHPLDVGGERRWRVLDAQLRRIRSWSTALAYIADYTAAHAPSPGSRGGRVRPRGDGRGE